MASPLAFGYKMAWLAVRTDDPEAVIDELGIEDARQSSWAEGIGSAYGSEAMGAPPAFVTPALDGWTLVASPGFFDELSDAEPERLAAFVSTAAHALGTEVQLFGTHRVVEGHGWAKADSGGLSRAYFYLGEIGECLVDEGRPTAVEASVALDSPGEETVMAVAGAWSLDPTRVEEEHPQAGEGWLGRLPASVSEAPAEPEDPGHAGRPWWKFW